MTATELAAAMREQAAWCERLGSPLYHELLLSIADNVEGLGVCWSVLREHAGASARSLPPLRFLAAIHRLTLEGRLPELARHYPSTGGAGDAKAVWMALRGWLERNDGGDLLQIPATVQTNEVARCCALLPGWLQIARRTGMPLRLLEIGCSAGLNLRWDRYRYETANGAWGDPGSAVVFQDAVAGPVELDATVRVVERSGCDLHPVEAGTEDGRLTLLSFVWPDQIDRFRQLSNAIEIARAVPAVLDRADAADWLEGKLSRLTHGVATVVYHSIVWLYLPGQARDRIGRIMAEAGSGATAEAPLAWLSMEPGEKEADVHLTVWPGWERKRIAEAGFHGKPVLSLNA